MKNYFKIGSVILFTIVLVILIWNYAVSNLEVSESIPMIKQNIDNKQMLEIKLSIQDYDELRYTDEENTIVIFPTFTGFAYGKNGFYDYFSGNCDDSCLTVGINDELPLQYASSQQGFMLLQLLEYPYLTDVEISRNPEIIKNYDKVIMLHNEYVSQSEFDAITNHPNVVFLYPNSLYAEIKVDFDEETISLVKGHGYPNGEDNGFDWEFDNTRPFEFDTTCEIWEFYEINNGHMLNCYPENVIVEKIDIIRAMKKY